MFRLEECGGIRKNLFFATAAQALNLVSAVLTSLVVPKVLGVGDYGYWQLFSLYSGYSGIAMLGVNDGLVLRLAGKHLSEVNYHTFRGELILVAFSQTVLLAILAVPLVVAWWGSPERLIVVVAVVVNGVICNITTFMSFLLQSVNLTHVQSKVSMVCRVAFFAMLLGLLSGGALGYVQLIVASVLSQLGFLVLVCLYMRSLLNGACTDWKGAMRDIIADSRSGFKVMVAYQADQLIVGVARSMVDVRWGIAVFGVFSFSTSIVMFFLSFVSQLSTVFLPMIRRLGDGGAVRAAGEMRAVLNAVLPLGYLLYFPVRLLISWWLPQYLASADFLAILLPICFFDCKMNLLCGTYFKALRKEGYLLVVNLLTMLASSLLAAMSIFLLDNAHLAALSVVACIAVRSVASEVLLFRLYGVSVRRQLASEVLLAAFFEVSIVLFDAPIAFLVVLTIYYMVNRDSLQVVGRLIGLRHA